MSTWAWNAGEIKARKSKVSSQNERSILIASLVQTIVFQALKYSFGRVKIAQKCDRRGGSTGNHNDYTQPINFPDGRIDSVAARARENERRPNR